LKEQRVGQRRYRAFLSYSHRDRRVAAWLHRALETYDIPQKLVGTHTLQGEVPRRLTPIFKDREELPAAHHLGEAIDLALADSDALIVLCSPDAKQSVWVDKEVERFKHLHGDNRVFALLIRGEPADAFPPSLAVRFRNGHRTDEPAEPIAADLRPEGDGHRRALLKLVAGLAGVQFDHLVGRDQQRRHRRMALATAASLAGMTLTTGLAVYAIEQRDEARVRQAEAQAQRAEADGLIEYMLTDLRGKLEPVGKLDVLKGVGDRALDYYSRQKLAQLDGDSLGRRARAMLLVAEVGDLQGNSEAARRGFIEAARSTGELLKRNPGNWQRVYDHAQSEFWLAYAAHNRGDDRGALPHFIAYRDLGMRMMALAPNKPESKIELASAEVNLGVALVAERKMAEAIASFDRAAATFESIRPRTRDIGLTLNQALGHKASALFALGDNGAALATRRKQLEALSAAPLAQDDREVQEASAVVDGQIGSTLLSEGKVTAGAVALARATGKWDELVALDPANKMWRGERNVTRMWQAVARSARPSTARAEMASIIADQRQLVSASADWVHKENLLRMIAVDRAIGGSSTAANEPIIAEAWARRHKLKADDRGVLAAVLISEGDRLAATDRRQASGLWNEASKLLPNDQSGTWALVHRARAARRLGQPDTHGLVAPPNAFAGIFAQGAGQ
jgi:tetratricopeptide (TPR) repeat protein